MNKSNGCNGEKRNVEPEVFFEIPVITTSSPSMDTDSEASPIYKNITKHTIEFHSDEETDTSFINNNNNSRNSIQRRVSFLRSLSPANLNSSGTSRGVCCLAKLEFSSIFILFGFCFRMFEDGRNRWQVRQSHGKTGPSIWCLLVCKSVSYILNNLENTEKIINFINFPPKSITNRTIHGWSTASHRWWWRGIWAICTGDRTIRLFNGRQCNGYTDSKVNINLIYFKKNQMK